MMEENLQSGKGTRSSFTKWQLVRLPALFRNHRSYHWLSKNSFWILISSDLKNFGFWFACGPRLQGDAIRELQSTSGNLIMEELHCLYSRLSITDFSVYAKAFVWITRNWKILKDMGIPDHFICLLRNLYAKPMADSCQCMAKTTTIL